MSASRTALLDLDSMLILEPIFATESRRSRSRSSPAPSQIPPRDRKPPSSQRLYVQISSFECAGGFLTRLRLSSALQIKLSDQLNAIQKQLGLKSRADGQEEQKKEEQEENEQDRK